MFLSLMEQDYTFRLVSNIGNKNRLLLLPSSINNLMFLPKINKSKPIEPQISSIDESNPLLPACIVQQDQVFTIIVVKDYNTVIVCNTER